MISSRSQSTLLLAILWMPHLRTTPLSTWSPSVHVPEFPRATCTWRQTPTQLSPTVTAPLSMSAEMEQWTPNQEIPIPPVLPPAEHSPTLFPSSHRWVLVWLRWVFLSDPALHRCFVTTACFHTTYHDRWRCLELGKCWTVIYIIWIIGIFHSRVLIGVYSTSRICNAYLYDSCVSTYLDYNELCSVTIYCKLIRVSVYLVTALGWLSAQVLAT